MAGYWNAAEATAEVVRGDWLDSGDLAHADDDGYLWFFGRKKQIIVHDGSNVSPFEVEGALREHPAIGLAGVVGVHDTLHGETIRAYVTLRDGATRPSSAELIVFCRDRIGYKAPEEIIFLDQMPLNPTGKIDRAGLKRWPRISCTLTACPPRRSHRVPRELEAADGPIASTQLRPHRRKQPVARVGTVRLPFPTNQDRLGRRIQCRQAAARRRPSLEAEVPNSWLLGRRSRIEGRCGYVRSRRTE